MLKILAIDDETNILELIKLYLTKEGYQVNTLDRGIDAVAKFVQLAPDLIILDLMLPDIDGYEVCRQIRQKSQVPILMLTARRDDVDKIVGLEMGADDYLTKPFNPRELIARIKAILRRSQSDKIPDSILIAAKLKIDLSKHEALIDGKPLFLRTKEFALLTTLMQNLGNVFSREKLLELVWGFDFYGETRTVDVHINHLRDKLAGSGLTIETLRGVGYKLTTIEGSK
jgi:two-component system, OmpR family, alkaline phosphatase synthesis response regulator PhoP